MRKKSIKFIIIILISFLWVVNTNKSVNAAAFSVSTSKSTLNPGDTFSVTINCSGLTGRFDLSGSSNIALNSSSVWAEGSNVTVTGTAKTKGTADITVSATNVSDKSGNDVTGSQGAKITVKEKASDSGNTNNSDNSNKTNNNSNTNTSNQNKQEESKEPTFSSVNQTVYATQEGINVRSSYSTSSSSIGKLKKGEEVTRTGLGSNGWSKVKYNGNVAYINSSLLTTTKPEEEEKSTTKSLKSLIIEEGTLSPDFDPETTRYEITIGKDVSKLNIDAKLEDEKSKIDISGNEDLQIGENTIKLVVTAEDGTARTYTIIVIKQEKELKLSKLAIKGIKLNPSFNKDIYEYTAEIDSTVDSLDIETLCDDEEATVEILGNDELEEGENTITIMIKSEDGKQNVTYQIIVNKINKVSDISNVISDSNDENKQYIIVGSVLGGIILLILIIFIIKKIIKNREDDGIELNFMDDIRSEDDENYERKYKNNFLNEEKKQFENEIIDTENTITENKNKLYNVEDDISFGNNLNNNSDDEDIDERPKRKKGKGKHF